MSKKKLMTFTIVILVISFFLFSCTVVENKGSDISEKDDIHSNNYKLTIEDIKKGYTEKKILNIEQINAEYVLVESQRETFANSFELYNLKTGDKDIMPTMGEFITLEKIEGENHIVFLSSGKNSESCFGTFPYYIRCIRTKDEIEEIDDFIGLSEDKYFKLSDSITSGSKNDSILSDIIVTLDGIQVLFEPIPGKEDIFYAAATDIPITNTYYDKDKKQMTIKMGITGINDVFKGKKEILTENNKYIGDIKIVQGSENIKLIFNVEDTEIEYIAKIKKTPDEDLPFLEISFRN